MESKKCFDDFEQGFIFNFEVAGLTAPEIISFATTYDPQRFHLDQGEAEQTHFGSLVASGFQTQLLCFQPFCREVLNNSLAVGSPGIEELKWLRPWYPGEKLQGHVELLNKRVSSRRSDRGYLEFFLTASTEGSPVISMRWTVIMLTC